MGLVSRRCSSKTRTAAGSRCGRRVPHPHQAINLIQHYLIRHYRALFTSKYVSHLLRYLAGLPAAHRVIRGFGGGPGGIDLWMKLANCPTDLSPTSAFGYCFVPSPFAP